MSLHTMKQEIIKLLKKHSVPTFGEYLGVHEYNYMKVAEEIVKEHHKIVACEVAKAVSIAVTQINKPDLSCKEDPEFKQQLADTLNEVSEGQTGSPENSFYKKKL